MKWKTKATEKFEITKKSEYEENEPYDDKFIFEYFGKKAYVKEETPEEIGKTFSDLLKNTLVKIIRLQKRFDYKIELQVRLKKIE